MIQHYFILLCAYAVLKDRSLFPINSKDYWFKLGFSRQYSSAIFTFIKKNNMLFDICIVSMIYIFLEKIIVSVYFCKFLQIFVFFALFFLIKEFFNLSYTKMAIVFVLNILFFIFFF